MDFNRSFFEQALQFTRPLAQVKHAVSRLRRHLAAYGVPQTAARGPRQDYGSAKSRTDVLAGMNILNRRPGTGGREPAMIPNGEDDDPGTAEPRFLQVAGAWMASNLRYTADLILPPVCLYCHAPLISHGVLCAACWQGIDMIRPPVCDRLGHPLPYATSEITISAAALRRPPLYARARAAARFSGVMRDLIHGFKYADRHEAVGLFVDWLAAAGAELIADADVLMPVPLYRWRLWKRRYNQAAILAQGLAQKTNVPLETAVLLRSRPTASQAGLPGQDRRRNVAAAFCLASGAEARIRGKRVLLVDDVITTGATLEACTAELKAGGAADVDCLALALASRPGEYE